MVFDHLFRLLLEKHSIRIVHGRLLQLPSLPVDCCVPTITDVPVRPGSASAEWANSSTSSERADSSRENHGDAFLQDFGKNINETVCYYYYYYLSSFSPCNHCIPGIPSRLKSTLNPVNPEPATAPQSGDVVFSDPRSKNIQKYQHHLYSFVILWSSSPILNNARCFVQSSLG